VLRIICIVFGSPNDLSLLNNVILRYDTDYYDCRLLYKAGYNVSKL